MKWAPFAVLAAFFGGIVWLVYYAFEPVTVDFQEPVLEPGPLVGIFLQPPQVVEVTQQVYMRRYKAWLRHVTIVGLAPKGATLS